MKKLMFLAAALFAALTVNAQEETKSEATEGGLKPDANKLTVEVAFNPFASTAATTLENGRLNASYSFNEKLALRLGLGFGVDVEKDENDIKTTENTFSLAPGIVYSFEGTEHFTPYVGGEVIVRSTKDKYDGNETKKVFGYGIQAFTGMNYYFSKNLYVGVEFGIGFNHSKTTVDDKDEKESKFAPYAQPAVRLGWTF